MRLLKPLSVMICFLFVAMDGLRAQEAAAPAASQPPAVDPVADDPVAAVPSTPSLQSTNAATASRMNAGPWLSE